MRDDDAVAGRASGGPAERIGGSVASRRPDKSGGRVRGGPAGRQDARQAGGQSRSSTERVRRQVLFDGETAVRFDTHCKSALPQLDPVKELNRILLSYLRTHGRKREIFDGDYPRAEARLSPDTQEDRQDTTAA
jgi:hypothetical protein